MMLKSTRIKVKGNSTFTTRTIHFNETGGYTVHLAFDNREDALAIREIKYGDLSLWLAEAVFTRRTTINMRNETPYVAMWFAVSGTFYCRLGDWYDGKLTGNEFNLVSERRLDYEVTFGEGHYFIVGVFVAPEYLDRWKPHFSWLGNFTDKIRSNVYMLGSIKSPQTPCLMTEPLMDIIEGARTGLLRAIYIKSKLSEVVMMAFIKMRKRYATPFVALNDGDSQKVEMIKMHLRENTNRKVSIKEIAKVAGMNRTDVTSLFKKVTNMTLHQFHLEERLQKGFNLLMETLIPVKGISAMVAFRTCPNFTAAFTKRFGMTPREVRRGVRLK